MKFGSVINRQNIAVFLFYTYMFFLPLDFVFTIKLGLPVSLSILIALASIVLLLFYEKRVAVRWEFIVFFIFTLYALIHPGTYLVSGISSIVGILTSVIVFIGAYSVVRFGYLKKENIFFGLNLFSLSILFYAFYFYFYEWDIVKASLIINPENARASAEGFDQNNFSTILAMSALIFLFNTYTHRSFFVFLYGTIFLFLFYLMTLTGSRSALISLGLGAAFLTFNIIRDKSIVIYKKTLVGVFFIAGLAAAIFVVISNPLMFNRLLTTIHEGSLSSRDVIWSYSIDLITSKPVFGYGLHAAHVLLAEKLGLYGSVKGSHNTIVTFYLTGGIVIGSLASFAYINFPLWFKYIYKFKQMSLVTHLLISLVLLVLLTSLSIDWLNRKYYWVFMGLLLGCISMSGKNKSHSL